MDSRLLPYRNPDQGLSCLETRCICYLPAKVVNMREGHLDSCYGLQGHTRESRCSVTFWISQREFYRKQHPRSNVSSCWVLFQVDFGAGKWLNVLHRKKWRYISLQSRSSSRLRKDNRGLRAHLHRGMKLLQLHAWLDNRGALRPKLHDGCQPEGRSQSRSLYCASATGGLHLLAAAVAVGRSSKAEALRVEVPVLPSRTASVCLIFTSL